MSSVTPLIRALSAIRVAKPSSRGGSRAGGDGGLTDLTDRLNHVVMYGLLLTLTLATGLRQYTGNPVACWVPVQYKERMYRNYVNNYCWIHRMYTVPGFEEKRGDETRMMILNLNPSSSLRGSSSSIDELAERRHRRSAASRLVSRDTSDLGFYRWVTVFFLLQALAFRAPGFVWDGLRKRAMSGVDVDKIVAMATEAAGTVMMTPSMTSSDGERKKNQQQLDHVAEFIHRWVISREGDPRGGERTASMSSLVTRMFFRRTTINSTSSGEGKLKKINSKQQSWRRASPVNKGGSISRSTYHNWSLFGTKKSGTQLVVVCLLVKFLYLANVIAQFYATSAFLKIDFWSFGSSAFRAYLSDGRWEDSNLFPRVAMCDFSVRQMTNVQKFTVQCVLTLNLFLEEMFLLVWFCLAFLLLANALSFLSWAWRALDVGGGAYEKFARRYGSFLLLSRSSDDSTERKLFGQMVRRYLRPDGLFVVRLVAANTSEMLATELVRHVWGRYRKYVKGDVQTPGLTPLEAKNSEDDNSAARNQGGRFTDPESERNTRV